jgi:hypothetical protein
MSADRQAAQGAITKGAEDCALPLLLLFRVLSGQFQKPAKCASIAETALSAFDPSDPPACAMSGRPPPPRPTEHFGSDHAPDPPHSSCSSNPRHRNHDGRFVVFATVDENDHAGAKLRLGFVGNAPFRSFGLSPSTIRAISLMPASRSPRSSPSVARRPCKLLARIGKFALPACDVSSISCATRDRYIPARPHPSAPRSGARPAATAPSEVTSVTSPISPVARHAFRRTAPANRSCPSFGPRSGAHRDHAHLVAVFLAEERHARRFAASSTSSSGSRPARSGG